LTIETYDYESSADFPLSAAVRAGDFLFVSGLAGTGPDEKVVPGGVGAETHKIIEDLAKILDLASANLKQVVRSRVFLTHASDFDAFNEVYRQYFSEAPPSRTTVVSELTLEAAIEIDFTVYVGS
jgi:enamine deaminase RidA (YjgF/YER057c/UK114 family)